MKQALWPELEEIGEERVRELLLLEIYRGQKRFYVEEWLRHLEFSRAKASVRPTEKDTTRRFDISVLVATLAVTTTALVGHLFMLN